jgi:peptidoglycan/LPS O-acetylase OafA/YrhL
MSRQLGALSGVAMMLIVLNHSIHMGVTVPDQWGYLIVDGWGRRLLSTLQTFGLFAVPIFLFASGSFFSYVARGNPPKVSLKFLFSSLRYLLYPYLFWSIMFYVLIYFQDNIQSTPLQYLKNLIVGYPFHFVPLLVFYYLISPLLVRLSQQYAGVLILCIAIYQVFLLNAVYPGILGFSNPAWTHIFEPPIIKTTMADWGIYFPLGLIYSLNMKTMQPLSKKWAWVSGGITVILFVLTIAGISKVYFPLAVHIFPLTFVLLIPAINRNSIPLVRTFENIGKKSYGIYLMHLIVLNLVLTGIRVGVPDLLSIPILLFPVLFILGLGIPIAIMNLMARLPIKLFYRYVFG